MLSPDTSTPSFTVEEARAIREWWPGQCTVSKNGTIKVHAYEMPYRELLEKEIPQYANDGDYGPAEVQAVLFDMMSERIGARYPNATMVGRVHRCGSRAGLKVTVRFDPNR